ncbi:hypothetical protein EDC01DRAFT_699999 [Geopyxis carbonaria]|nr:hypothetical protein EDC01DRAFT_699999 [Geopyxis carbonaria]
MTSSKSNSGTRPKLASTASSSGVPPTAAVSNVYAAGESSDAPRPPPIPTRSPARPDPASRNLRRDRNYPSAADADSRSQEQAKRSSWFSRKGTWPRSGAAKSAAAATKLASENASMQSISNPPSSADEHSTSDDDDTTTAASSVATITKQTDKKVEKRKSEGRMYSGIGNASSLSLPLLGRGNGAPPVASVAPPVATPAPAAEPPSPPPSSPPPSPKAVTREATPAEMSKDDEPPTESAQPVEPEPQSADLANGSWFGWWYGQPQPVPAPETEDSKQSKEEPQKRTEPIVEPEPAPEPAQIPVIRQEPEHPPAQYITPNREEAAIPTLDGSTEPENLTSAPSARPRSWFGLWGAGGEPPSTAPVPASPAEPVIEEELSTPAPTPADPIGTPVLQAEPTQIQEAIQDPVPALSNIPANRGSYGWAFWSRGAEPNAPDGKSMTGEVAIARDSTESSPQKATVKPADGRVRPTTSASALREEKRPSTPASVRSKASAQKSTNSKVATPKRTDTSETSTSVNSTPPLITPRSSSLATDPSAARKKLREVLPENHLLPEFETCYGYQDQPSMIQSLTKYFKNPPTPNKKHLYLAKQAPRPKKAVAIGVHGFFPMRLVRTVLGEPTGTSIRFANHAALSIKRWAEKNNIEIEVEKIALEGEGKVGDRVEMLWKLLQNWMDHVRSADFVLMAAHSQGVIVGMQLMARLIEEGCVDNARIGFTAMAGINLGPFGHLPTTLLTGSARELFEFQKQDSAVSRKYVQALRTVLAHNVRILYVGSIDDQLVPMESSLIANMHHPYIFRAVFVDGRVHAPDFLSHLVGFAMKLRNLGISDHGLIRELSSPLAGSLYGGEGHSRIYDDGAVYDLGVRHALETTDCDGVPLRVEPFELPTNSNPYFLPWSLRGMLEENHVRTHLHNECTQLLEQFENWKPTSKTLKDVKFRLEGIRSKL